MSLLAARTSGTGTVGATSAVLAAQNRGRLKVVVTNTHATQTLSIAFATVVDSAPTAVAGSGVIVSAGGRFETDFRGALAVIGSGASTTYGIVEY